MHERLKHIFASYGTPRRIESDNGPPFNSKEFSGDAMQGGIQHHKVTPLHPRANCEAESFVRVLNKTEQIASLQGKNRFERQNAMQDMLIPYRSTPHPVMGITPYEANERNNSEDQVGSHNPATQKSGKDNIINQKDAEYKQRMKQQREWRNTIDWGRFFSHFYC